MDLKTNVMGNVLPNECTGCGSCVNSCPVDAIRMSSDLEGFLHPTVDDSCISCGKCLKNCPVLFPKYNNNPEPECRAVAAVDDIRLKASSGGIFASVSKKFLEQGGIVYGARYVDNFKVSHARVDKESDLPELVGSKYVQSDVEHTFRQVREDLSNGKMVLYCGCPCQIAGLYSYLGDDNVSRLYTIDLICHGVPSHKVLSSYLDDDYGVDSIQRLDFRDKSVYGWSTEMNVYFKDGSSQHKKHDEDAYYKAFLPCMSLRPSCASCKFSRLPRQGDISVGDFWGIDAFRKELNDHKGLSVVLLNNTKGNELIDACSDWWIVNEVRPIEEALRVNKTIVRPFHSHPARRRFFEELGSRPFDKHVDECLRHHYDVGVVGLWYGLNYGSILTYYALYKVIQGLGYSVLMINKPDFLWNSRYSNRSTIANKFIYSECNVSNTRKTPLDCKQLNEHCDTFVVGSDVVWNYEICGKSAGYYFFLDFVKNTKKKISVASSFGAGFYAPPDVRAISKYYLQKFDYLSVREKEASDICKSVFGVESDLVVDPVFMCDRILYDVLASRSKKNYGSNYIMTYILGPSVHKKENLEYISKHLGKKLINVPNPNNISKFTEITKLESEKDVEVCDWLNLLSGCDYYIGDSFHGLCFSLIFQRPFVILMERGMPSICRFTNLLEKVSLEDRIIYNDEDITTKLNVIDKPIDYDYVSEVLERESMLSVEWLKNALESEKVYEPSPADAIIDSLVDRLDKLEKKAL